MTKQDTLPPLPELRARFQFWYGNDLLAAPVHQSREDRQWAAFQAGARAALAAQAPPPPACVWAVENKVSLTLFASKADAEAFVGSFPMSVSGGLQVSAMPVLGAPQQAQGVPASLDLSDLQDRLVAVSEAVADQDDRAAQAMLSEALKLLAAAPQAEPQTPAPAPGTSTFGALKAVIAEKNKLNRALELACNYLTDAQVEEIAAAMPDGEKPQPQPEREPQTDELLLAVQSAITCSYADHGRRSVNLQAWDRLIQAVAVVTHGIGTKGGEPSPSVSGDPPGSYNNWTGAEVDELHNVLDDVFSDGGTKGGDK